MIGWLLVALSSTVDLRGDGHEISIQLSPGERQFHLQVGDLAREALLTAPWEVQAVEAKALLRGNERFLHAKILLRRKDTAEEFLWRLDAGRLRLLFHERTGPLPPDFDRARQLLITDEILTHETSDSLRRCDGKEILLDGKRLDLGTDAWKPIPDPAEKADELPPLRPRGGSPRLNFAVTPVGTMLNLRPPAPVEVHGLEITATHDIKVVYLYFDTSKRYRTSLRRGRSARIEFPPQRTSCITLAWEGGLLPSSSIRVWTRVDEPGGLESLEKELDGDAAAMTAKLLVAIGHPRSVGEALARSARTGDLGRARVFLTGLGESARPYLLEILADASGSPDGRAFAAEHLVDAPQAVRQLLNCARDPAPEVRRACRKTLQSPLAVPMFREELAASHLDPVHEQLLLRLVTHHTRGDAGLAQLVASRLQDSFPFATRYLALRALEGATASVVNQIAPLLKDPDPFLRRAAAAAMRSLPDELKRDSLRQALEDTDPGVRASAIEALGTGARFLSSDLSRRVRQEHWPFVRQRAVVALRGSCDPHTLQALRELNRDSVDDRTRIEALDARLHCGDPSTLAELLVLIGNSEGHTALRMEAARVLRRAPSPPDAPLVHDLFGRLLSDAMLDEDSARVAAAIAAIESDTRTLIDAMAPIFPLVLRAAAAHALGLRCEASARSALEIVSEDEEPQLRRAARAALRKCQKGLGR